MILTVLGAVKNHVDVGRAVILQGYIVITHHPVMVRPGIPHASKQDDESKAESGVERARAWTPYNFITSISRRRGDCGCDMAAWGGGALRFWPEIWPSPEGSSRVGTTTNTASFLE